MHTQNLIKMTGETVRQFKVLCRATNHKSKVMWEVQCTKCGKEFPVDGNKLRRYGRGLQIVNCPGCHKRETLSPEERALRQKISEKSYSDRKKQFGGKSKKEVYEQLRQRLTDIWLANKDVKGLLWKEGFLSATRQIELDIDMRIIDE
jgi:hypothetical protein